MPPPKVCQAQLDSDALKDFPPQQENKKNAAAAATLLPDTARDNGHNIEHDLENLSLNSETHRQDTALPAEDSAKSAAKNAFTPRHRVYSNSSTQSLASSSTSYSYTGSHAPSSSSSSSDSASPRPRRRSSSVLLSIWKLPSIVGGIMWNLLSGPSTASEEHHNYYSSRNTSTGQHIGDLPSPSDRDQQEDEGDMRSAERNNISRVSLATSSRNKNAPSTSRAKGKKPDAAHHDADDDTGDDLDSVSSEAPSVVNERMEGRIYRRFERQKQHRQNAQDCPPSSAGVHATSTMTDDEMSGFSGEEPQSTRSIETSPSKKQHHQRNYSDSAPSSDNSAAREAAIVLGTVPGILGQPGMSAVILEDPDYGISMEGRPPCSSEDTIMTKQMISVLHSALPPRWRLCSRWSLLYSTTCHGFSLSTLYQQSRYFNGPVLLCVRDDSDTVFGAFASEPWQPHIGHHGNGECFLWKVLTHEVTPSAGGNAASSTVAAAPTIAASTITSGRSNNASTTTLSGSNAKIRIKKFASTGKNNYFLLSEPSYMAAGCGNGAFGLWIDSELLSGVSHPVPTFDNETLSSYEMFDCICVELWGLLPLA